ncbi:eukaryotic translation initiation factor 3 subunit I-like, partial [Phalaenopsis equestris]|uniref:eukaryotic translation initiation factor 3 subunit I-like n=1 Tax=Phalaenopsis equestris TaxID=78828 RepID=UPI0009E5A837
MRPILMKGHERPLTFLKYNREGDLLFSCAKDHNPTVWFADNGERLGTYRGHNGAVWCCDVSHLCFIMFCLIEIGDSILTIKGPQGRINRAVWGPLNKTIISAGEDTFVRIWDSETGQLLKESDKETGHQKTISSLVKSADGSHFLTGSLDKSAKLWDSRTLTLIKTYVTERPVNACAISPLLDH